MLGDAAVGGDDEMDAEAAAAERANGAFDGWAYRLVDDDFGDGEIAFSALKGVDAVVLEVDEIEACWGREGFPCDDDALAWIHDLSSFGLGLGWRDEAEPVEW